MRRIALSGAVGVGLVAIALGIFVASRSHSQTAYRIGEGNAVGADAASADAGPVRMARVSDVSGSVAWRPDSSAQWSNAKVNVPVRQGAQFSVRKGGRAEIQFDDGSALRLGGGSIATLQNMYSDKRGEYTEVALNSGLATLRTRNNLSTYQVNTPDDSVMVDQPSDVRFGIGDQNLSEIDVQSGQADVQYGQTQEVVDPGQEYDTGYASNAYEVTQAPAQPDSWDQYCAQRDQADYTYDSHLPSDIGLVAGNLDSYGTWHDDPQYGEVWSPAVSSDWRPYSQGNWVWVNPVGWTWCESEPWGYAPSHYGTWVHEAYGWSWCPGPAQQAWSPAVVQFTDYDNEVAWCPLAPDEVRYPAVLSFGFADGDWALNFSIGQVASYEPYEDGYCASSPWDNRYVNRTVNIYNINNITNIYNNGYAYDRGTYGNGRFISRNAGWATVATRQGFQNGSGFGWNHGDRRFFTQGRDLGPRNGQISGPWNVRPTLASFSPDRRAAGWAPSSTLLARNVYSPTLPQTIRRVQPTRVASNGWGTVARNPVIGTNPINGQRRIAQNPVINNFGGRTAKNPVVTNFGSRTQRSPGWGTTASQIPVTASQRQAGRANWPQPRSTIVAARRTQPGTFGRQATQSWGHNARTAPRSSGYSVASRTPMLRSTAQPRAFGQRPSAYRPSANRAWSQPQRTYTPAARTYTPPTRTWSRPQRTYTPPTRSYSPPVQRYSPPTRSYSPPVQRSYAPPTQSWSRPQRTYTPPTRSYNPPVQRYNPPTRSYSPPRRPSAPPQRGNPPQKKGGW